MRSARAFQTEKMCRLKVAVMWGGVSIQKLPFDVSILPRATAGCVVWSWVTQRKSEWKVRRAGDTRYSEGRIWARLPTSPLLMHLKTSLFLNSTTSPLTSPPPSPHLLPFLLSTLLFLDFLNSWWILEVLLRFLSCLSQSFSHIWEKRCPFDPITWLVFPQPIDPFPLIRLAYTDPSWRLFKQTQCTKKGSEEEDGKLVNVNNPSF